jgi:ecdysteroid 25-hydroxylase CYP302A1
VEKIRNSHLQKIKKGSGVHGEVSTPSAVAHFSKKKYSVAIDLVALKMTTFEEKSQSPPTLLEQYIASKDLDFKDIVGMACDVLLAGMDTITYSSSFLLYHLGKNPSVQDALYEEATRILPDPSAPITPAVYEKAKYAKCVVKESLRLRPVSIGVGRQITSDLVFSGYKVPTGVRECTRCGHCVFV